MNATDASDLGAMVLDAINRSDRDAPEMLAKVKTLWSQGSDRQAAASMVYFHAHEATFTAEVKTFCDSVLLSSPLSQLAAKCLLSYGMKRLPLPLGYSGPGPMGAWINWRNDPTHAASDERLPAVGGLGALPHIEKGLVLHRLLQLSPALSSQTSAANLLELQSSLTSGLSKGESAVLNGMFASQVLVWPQPRGMNSSSYLLTLDGPFASYREAIPDAEIFLGQALTVLKSQGLHDTAITARELTMSLAVPVRLQRTYAPALTFSFKNQPFEWIAAWKTFAELAQQMSSEGQLWALPLIIALSPFSMQDTEIFASHSLASYRSGAYPDPYRTVAEGIARFSSIMEKEYASFACPSSENARYTVCPSLVGLYTKLLVPTLLSMQAELKDATGLAECPLGMTAMKSPACQTLSVVSFLPDANAAMALHHAAKKGNSLPYELFTRALSRVAPANNQAFEANFYFNSSGVQTSRTVAMDWLCYAVSQNYFQGTYTNTGVPLKFFDPLYFVSRLVFAQNAPAPDDSTAFYAKWAKVPSDTLYCDDNLAFDRPATYIARRMKDYALDLAYLFPLENIP
jgi:hypothetical protein